MSNCHVKFWKDTDDKKGTGRYKEFDGVQDVPDFSEVHWHDHSNDNMKDDASWVDTGSQAWIRVYSKSDYGGRSYLIGPSRGVNLKKIYVDDDDMNDTVESFQLYDHQPIDTVQINSNFRALYPGSDYGQKDNLYNTEWYAQNAHYRVYDPTMVVGSDKISFTIKLDHLQAESDDHAVVTFAMNYKGDFVDQIKVTYDMGNAAHVPDWVVKLVDGAIDAAAWGAKLIADGAEIVLTDGVGVVATVETNKVIDYTAKALAFCVDHLNTVLKVIFKWQDDGGTMYFSSIVSHSIARLVLAYYQELWGADTNTKMSFSGSSFLKGVGAGDWESDRHNPYVIFEHHDYPYRVYYPDNSFLYARGGAVSSACIAAVTNNEKDDRLVLQATYDPHGNLFSVTGGIDIFLVRNIDDYVAPTTGVITYDASRRLVRITSGGSSTVLNYGSIEEAYSDLMTQALNDTASQFDLDITSQQRHMVDASVTVLNAMTAAIA